LRAATIRQFGPPSVIVTSDLPRPEPAEGEVLVRVKAAGVGPWDALIREGKSVVAPSLPLVLGSDLSGVVEAVGPGVSEFKVGDEVYGVTNERFTGAYAEYASASATKIAPKPRALNYIEAASVPVVSVTAWQMLFEYARAAAGQTVLIHGAAGNVGAYALQLARNAGLHVIATASSRDSEYVRSLGAERGLDYQKAQFEEDLTPVDAVIDPVGGEVRERSLRVLGQHGILVSVGSPIPEEMARRYGARVIFFLVEVSTKRLKAIGELFDGGKLAAHVGTVLPLEEARVAHEMLAGAPSILEQVGLTAAE
jgi:NADPH:quinone reductase-like Zn-dependent oxidoreductase